MVKVEFRLHKIRVIGLCFLIRVRKIRIYNLGLPTIHTIFRSPYGVLYKNDVKLENNNRNNNNVDPLEPTHVRSDPFG